LQATTPTIFSGKGKISLGSAMMANICTYHRDSDNNDVGSLASFLEDDSESNQSRHNDDVFHTGNDDPTLVNNGNHTSKLHTFEPIREDMYDISANDCLFESSYESSSSYASVPVYTIYDGEKRVAVPYPEFYRCRRRMLEPVGLHQPSQMMMMQTKLRLHSLMLKTAIVMSAQTKTHQY
jgi:hypothetical protein